MIALMGAVGLIGLVATPVAVYQLRLRKFHRVQHELRQHGASLEFDLVDGNYLVHVDTETRGTQTIRSIASTLKELPTGFTIIGPGECRSFWIDVSGEALSDEGLATLCDLKPAWITINGGSLSKTGGQTLAMTPGLTGIVLNRIRVSPTVLAELRSSKPMATIVVDGQTK